jgi:hypothetical protein
MIILEVELMFTDDPDFVNLICKHKAMLISKFWPPYDAIPGDGEIYLYSFPTLDDARAFAVDCFGDDPDIETAVEGIYYRHVY